MKHFAAENFVESSEEPIRPLEYSAHTLWAEAYGLPQLLHNASPAEIAANREEFIEAANMVLAAFEVKQ